MTGIVFINYRRDDTKHAAGRLRDRLAAEFTREQVFMDVDNIPLGVDFVEYLGGQVGRCQIMVSLIGPRWLEMLRRKAGDADDFVRIEIEAALERGILVIPALIDGAAMPRADELPESVRPLVRRNAALLRHESFGADAGKLARAIEEALAAAGQRERDERERAEAEARAKATADSRKRETKAARQPEAAPAASASQPKSEPPRVPWRAMATAAGIAVFAGAGYVLWPGPAPQPGYNAAEAAFASVKRQGTKAAYEDYLERNLYAVGPYAEEARRQLARLETAAFEEAARHNTVEAYWRFRETWPKGAHFAEAGERIAAREGEAKKAAVRRAPSEPAVLDAERERALKPKDEFQECPNCPRMVVIPAGSFTMGSPATEPQRDSDEGPEHRVTIAKFAAGKFAVTFDEWDACVADGGCGGYKPSDEGWGRGDRPVINVSWNDAQSYVTWLKKKTGKEYRLLTEAEREYATRAGTQTPFWWGKSITPDQANYDGNYVYEGGGSKGVYRQKTVPVKSFEANPWGLYQVHGNVWEWCEHVWHSNYSGAPTDGSAWLEGGDSSLRVLRGGSWYNGPRNLRAAYRVGLRPDVRGSRFGFRVSRTLNP